MGDFKVVIGDWSDDGHGKTQTFVVKVSNKFSSEQLVENYKRNVELFGFSPESFAVDYEDSTIDEDDALKLIDAGISRDVFEEGFHYGRWELNKHTISMLEICMFFVGHGLDDFSWEKSSEQMPVLFGGSSALCGNDVGYGLFY